MILEERYLKRHGSTNSIRFSFTTAEISRKCLLLIPGSSHMPNKKKTWDQGPQFEFSLSSLKRLNCVLYLGQGVHPWCCSFSFGKQPRQVRMVCPSADPSLVLCLEGSSIWRILSCLMWAPRANREMGGEACCKLPNHRILDNSPTVPHDQLPLCSKSANRELPSDFECLWWCAVSLDAFYFPRNKFLGKFCGRPERVDVCVCVCLSVCLSVQRTLDLHVLNFRFPWHLANICPKSASCDFCQNILSRSLGQGHRGQKVISCKKAHISKSINSSDLKFWCFWTQTLGTKFC